MMDPMVTTIRHIGGGRMSRWSTPTTTGLRNVHEREVPIAVEHLWQLVSELGTESDPLWPSDRWPRLRLSDGVSPDSRGGHGPVRYRVDGVEPEGWVRFRFEPETGFRGWHEFRVSPAATGSRLTHIFEIERPSTAVRLVVVPLHDAVLEDLLDQLESVVAGRPVNRRPLSVPVRARRALVAARMGLR